jgi:hypothetical protein
VRRVAAECGRCSRGIVPDTTIPGSTGLALSGNCLRFPEIGRARAFREQGATALAIKEQIMTAIAETPFARLDTEGRLLKPILNADTHVAGRYGYRGEISYDDPETLLKEVFSVSEAGKPAIGFLAGSIKQYETLPKLVETFGTALNGDGKYFIYIADLPRGNRFHIRFGDVGIFAIFLDETTVYNELIDTFYVDKGKLKKFDTSAKLDALADVGLQYASLSDYAEISYEDGLKRKNAA